MDLLLILIFSNAFSNFLLYSIHGNGVQTFKGNEYECVLMLLLNKCSYFFIFYRQKLLHISGSNRNKFNFENCIHFKCDPIVTSSSGVSIQYSVFRYLSYLYPKQLSYKFSLRSNIFQRTMHEQKAKYYTFDTTNSFAFMKTYHVFFSVHIHTSGVLNY